MSKRRGSGKHIDRLVHPLGFTNYESYLKGEWWLEFRATYEQSKLPKKCVACGYPEYVLHHINYDHLGAESFSDVIPVCHRCHLVLHKQQAKLGIAARRPDLTFKKIFKWSQNETNEHFKDFHNLWRAEGKSDGVKFERNPKEQPAVERHAGDYYKISRDFQNFRQYVNDGYTPMQLAQMYGVGIKYVMGYLEKYPEYFDRPIETVGHV